jgi:hypothetical protein
MACRTGKIEHQTSDQAFAHVRDLEYKNACAGNDLLSIGLGAYPCRWCKHWHVGRRDIPTCYHYDTCAVLDTMTDDIALTPDKPRSMPGSVRRQNSGAMLAIYQLAEEREPLTWFTWSADWDRRGAPHLGTFTSRPAEQRSAEGLIRIGVPASVVSLRWSDYLARNNTPGKLRHILASYGDPSNWLATDQPVPSRLVRSIEAWYRGAWIDANEAPDDYDVWLLGVS